jgi:flavodoxin
MKGLIVYSSKTGKTKKMGEEIATFLKKNDIETSITPVEEIKNKNVNEYNYVFLGCWTSGLMILNQHPNQDWVNSIKNLPEMTDKKIGLFTTYKLATGSMFKKMKKAIPNANGNIRLEMKSRNGLLSVTDQLNLLELIK